MFVWNHDAPIFRKAIDIFLNFYTLNMWASLPSTLHDDRIFYLSTLLLFSSKGSKAVGLWAFRKKSLKNKNNESGYLPLLFPMFELRLPTDLRGS